MLNFNGKLIAKSDFKLDFNNRGFAYGDAVFDTLKSVDKNIVFLEDHYFRLMASMRMLRMEIPLTFTQDFYKNEIDKVLNACNLTDIARIKFTVYRNSGGFYTPQTNSIRFLVEANNLNPLTKSSYTVDVFKDYHVNIDLLSSIKTNNKILNVLSSIYTKENNLDNCLLINTNKQVVEANNANVFLIFGNKIVTPPISDGCIKGILRKKVIESIKQAGEFIFEERSISTFDLQKADSMFLTNSIIDIQTVTKYRKKEYNIYLVDMVKNSFKTYTTIKQ